MQRERLIADLRAMGRPVADEAACLIEADGDRIKRQSKRIHEQRVNLRRNWEISEQRAKWLGLWRRVPGHVALRIRQQRQTNQLKSALESIAANRCCEKCQEAALWAEEALQRHVKEGGFRFKPLVRP